jgi:RNA polymerase sigma-70 factor (ECF subfamily)
MHQPEDTSIFFRQVSQVSESAASELDRRYRDRLCALVEREMNIRYRRREDPEDVVQSVFRTFFRRASQGEFRFDNQAGLWSLLQRITRCKILNHIQFHHADIRDVAREQPCDGLAVADEEGAGPAAWLLGETLEAVLNGMDPQESAVFRLQLFGLTIGEIVQTVLADLSPPFPEILQLRLQGCSEREIAQRIGCGREAVRYRLKRLRLRLNALLQDQSRRQ